MSMGASTCVTILVGSGTSVADNPSIQSPQQKSLNSLMLSTQSTGYPNTLIPIQGLEER
jgi:riboflavin biosynthesis pyrimidine reductase